jgi:uncharacterized protein
MVERAFLERIEAYRRARNARLRAPDGWLSLVGRWVLEPGDTDLGVGVANLDHGRVKITLRPGLTGTCDERTVQEHTWNPEDDGPGPLLFVDGVRYELLRQRELIAIRARDPESPARAAFTGLPCYAPDERFVVRARLEPAREPRTITLSTSAGGQVQYASPGTLRFSLEGREHHLDPCLESPGATRYFILFTDATNADETYGGGRFVYAPLADAEKGVRLDFNEAYNPPCAITPFASCPLAPAQNRLSVRIEAGEKRLHP